MWHAAGLGEIAILLPATARATDSASKAAGNERSGRILHRIPAAGYRSHTVPAASGRFHHVRGRSPGGVYLLRNTPAVWGRVHGVEMPCTARPRCRNRRYCTLPLRSCHLEFPHPHFRSPGFPSRRRDPTESFAGCRLFRDLHYAVRQGHFMHGWMPHCQGRAERMRAPDDDEPLACPA